ncbi:MAG TPA: right-handed parallel beta-helix repeat-containing protein [Candidatus Solibacter sp.]|nr:right-handed parallel beta-helix repeat-containing protein [Candidatus Solibacter sp.]
MRRILALLAVIFASTLAMATSIVVNCDAGQSLSQALSTLNKNTPNTVWVKGTCAEYVLIDGFEELTINGTKGAALQQPSITPPTPLVFVLSIYASRGVTISGLAFHSLPTAFSSIAVGYGSTDVILQNLAIDGPWGIVVFDASQVFVNGVTITISGGYAALAAWDKSDVHIKDCSFQRASDSNFYAGITVSSGHVTMQGSTIREMQQGITVGANGSVDLVYYDATSPVSDVFMNNSPGINYNGVVVSNDSSLNISTAKLHIVGAGQTYGWDTGAILVQNESSLDAGASLVITSSHGQGVVVSNNSHANLAGSSITGSQHGGLVVVNGSTATVYSSSPLTTISANQVDLFCDSRSQIAGAMNISGAAVLQCANLVSDIYESMP